VTADSGQSGVFGDVLVEVGRVDQRSLLAFSMGLSDTFSGFHSDFWLFFFRVDGDSPGVIGVGVTCKFGRIWPN